MKKKHILILSVALILVCAGAVLYRTHDNKRNDEMLNLSMECLMDTENGGIKGHCSELANGCLWRCPSCSAVYEAEGNHLGPGYGITGRCSECGEVVE